MPSVDQHYRALSGLVARDALTEQHRSMLRFHLARRTLTATQMAEHMGQADYRWSNLHYGKLARLISEELEANKVTLHYQPNLDGSKMWTSVIAGIIHGASEKDVEMVLRDEVAEALRKLDI